MARNAYCFHLKRENTQFRRLLVMRFKEAWKLKPILNEFFKDIALCFSMYYYHFFLKKKCVQERAKHQADFVLLLGSFSLAKDMFSWIFRLKCRSHDKTIYNSINDNWLLETVEKKKPFSLACNLNSIFFPLFVILHSMASFCRLNFSFFFPFFIKKLNYIIIKEKFGFWNSHSTTRYIKENVNSF